MVNEHYLGWEELWSDSTLSDTVRLGEGNWNVNIVIKRKNVPMLQKDHRNIKIECNYHKWDRACVMRDYSLWTDDVTLVAAVAEVNKTPLTSGLLGFL